MATATKNPARPPCTCGHGKDVHAMSFHRTQGQYCKLCPCTSYSPRREEEPDVPMEAE